MGCHAHRGGGRRHRLPVAGCDGLVAHCSGLGTGQESHQQKYPHRIGALWADRHLALARSALVSVKDENIGGLFFHPIGKTSGNVISCSPGTLDGKTIPSFGMSSMLRQIL
mmetsp:Transcript_15619/g.35763  ORF Transcript_15619/g.35763 Transcript_15619/m.35763 type:complete len:111 (-) Transcript_15619:340-672(-)